MDLKSVRDADIAGKKVLVRVDFNEPIVDGVINDDTRIKAAIPTIQLLKQRGAVHITLMSHLGRPDGKVVEGLRTAPLMRRLSELTDTAGVEMLENVRFNPGEETNDPQFAAELAGYGEIFVNDAFADAHRAHASIVGVAKLLPAYAGLLVEREVEKISAALNPVKPAMAMVGGAKFETKIPLLTKLLEIYDRVLLGGALANDILHARGVDIKESLLSKMPPPQAMVDDARIQVPTDFVWEGEKIVDIGPQTGAEWARVIAEQHFILWNGPMGMYEFGKTAGTDKLAEALVSNKILAVIGGGDTAAALEKISFDSEKVFVSTGGGAMLQFLADGTLPGLEPLKK